MQQHPAGTVLLATPSQLPWLYIGYDPLTALHTLRSTSTRLRTKHVTTERLAAHFYQGTPQPRHATRLKPKPVPQPPRNLLHTMPCPMVPGLRLYHPVECTLWRYAGLAKTTPGQPYAHKLILIADSKQILLVKDLTPFKCLGPDP